MTLLAHTHIRAGVTINGGKHGEDLEEELLFYFPSAELSCIKCSGVNKAGPVPAGLLIQIGWGGGLKKKKRKKDTSCLLMLAARGASTAAAFSGGGTLVHISQCVTQRL